MSALKVRGKLRTGNLLCLTCVFLQVFIGIAACARGAPATTRRTTRATSGCKPEFSHVGYLASHEDICVSLCCKGRTAGIFQSHDLPPGEVVIEVYTDSDWASDRSSRRSISCCTILIGKCLLFSASRTQKVVSLSSADRGLMRVHLELRIQFCCRDWGSGVQTNLEQFSCLQTVHVPEELSKGSELDAFDISHFAYYGFKLVQNGTAKLRTHNPAIQLSHSTPTDFKVLTSEFSVPNSPLNG